MVKLPADALAPARLLTGTKSHEDAAVVRLPDNIAGKALVQTLDFFTPVVNDPYSFGLVSAANALSDVYAMGGEPWCAMNIVCFPGTGMDEDILAAILQGGADKLAEAGVVLAGGHSVNDPEIKFGLSVTGFVDAGSFAVNTGLEPGQQLLLTKPLGTGILATALKARLEDEDETERLIVQTASRLNKGPGRVIRELGLKAATDVTGFGLGGHLLEMANASGVRIHLWGDAIPALPRTRELAAMGLVPAGSHANRLHRQSETSVASGLDRFVLDLVFDAQTSGGMVLALAPEQMGTAITMLSESGDTAYHIGEVLQDNGSKKLEIS